MQAAKRWAAPPMHHSPLRSASIPQKIGDAGSARYRLGKRRYRLKLVCEKCMKPVGDGYIIDRPGEWTAKLVPALKASLTVVKVGNARNRGPLVPSKPVASRTRVFGFVVLLIPLARAPGSPTHRPNLNHSTASGHIYTSEQ